MTENPFKNSKSLPVIIGSVGGVNPSGRSGQHRGYGFMVRESLESSLRKDLVIHQARLMNFIRWTDSGWRNDKDETLASSDVAARLDPVLDDHCFIRRPQANLYFDPYAIPVQRKITLEVGEVMWPRKKLPSPLPEGWTVTGEDPENRLVRIQISKETEAYIPHTDTLEVSCGGLIPDGISLSSRGFGTKEDKIPRNVKLSLFGANDAMKTLGVSFEEIAQIVAQDQIGLYIGSAMGQLDQAGLAGYIQGTVLDRHVASTALPFSLNNMAADFVAAYVLGSLGHITCDVAACATFLFNLYHAVRDIRLGKIQFALVGASDAPIQPWVFAAYNAMRALGRDESLRAAKRFKKVMGPQGEMIEDLLRSAVSIPFGDNFGFTLAEGSQFLTLFHPDLSAKLGVMPQGAVGEVFCHSDGWKSSISKPGIGNYLSFGRALGSLQRDLGLESLQKRTFVSAHGSSTPQNRQTESSMFDQFAGTFGIEKWPVTAVKSWLGHTLGAASGDQVTCALGAFHHGMIGRIRNLDHIPDDVSQKHLLFLQENHSLAKQPMDACVVNSKGFGGHNATAVIYSPKIAQDFLFSSISADEKRHLENRAEQNKQNQKEFEEKFLQGAEITDYNATRPFEETDIASMDRDGLTIHGLGPKIRF